MLIHTEHPDYCALGLEGNSLFFHPPQGERVLLHDGIIDVAVAVDDNYIHTIAFMENKDYAWYFHGEKGFHRDRLDLGQVYGGAAQLVIDTQGNGHLFYLIKQSAGKSGLLKHLSLTDAIGASLAVSPNVSPRRGDFNASWHSDGYLHVVYCSHREGHLYYRVFDPKQSIWSGAILFSSSACTSPQLISAGKLYLFWLEGDGETKLQVREKEEVWSQPIQISSKNLSASGVGFALEKTGGTVFWWEQTKSYRAAFNRWLDREEFDPTICDYIWIAAEGITLPSYRLRQSEIVFEATSPKDETPAAPVVVAQKTDDKLQQEERAKEAKIQDALREQTFRVLREWDTVSEEIRRWRREITQPEAVDLSPLLNRLERLERRFVSQKRAEKQRVEQWQNELGEIRLDVVQYKRRVQDLEQAQKRREASFWHRLLKRD